MMNTHGNRKPLVVVGDTDGLIAILHKEDAHHEEAVETATRLFQQDAQTVFPLTTVVETVTTLKRKLNKPELAAHVIQQVTNSKLSIENVDTEMLNSALKVFDPKGSKKNTLFDALVIATAQKLNTTIIFSTDDWYGKRNFTLAVNLVKKQSTKKRK